LANVKISALPAATTPLAGTEVLPIVQSGVTAKVSVADLTSGRAITAYSITDSTLTSGRVTYAGTAGLLQDSANLLFNGTTLTANTLNLTNALGIAYGGTGQITANASFNALAPSQTGNSGKYLTTDGANTSWATNPLGTVTSITAGTGLTGGTITTSGTIAIDTSVVATLTGTQTLTNKTISGASNTLSNIGNASLTNSAITINGTSTSLGGSISVGTVTSVSGTAPVSVATGTSTPVISMAAANTSTNGYLTSTDWNTFNGKSNTNGTVTSVAALTLGTTGTDFSSTVATGTTTPVITLNVPTASAANRGALSSADWTTFNGKQAALVSGTNIKTVNGTTLLGSGDLGIITGTYGGTGINNGSNTITTAGNLTFAGAFTQSFTATANTAVTLPAGATAASNNLLSSATAVGIVTGTPSSTTYLRGDGTWSGVSGASGGTVTSVAATVPAFLSITGSPITTSGTLAIAYSGTALPVANGGTGTTTSTGTAGSVVLSNNPTLAGLTDSGNFTFTGTGNRITGDFSTTTLTNRPSFQSSVINGATVIQALPNGTGVASAYDAYNNSDPTNAGVARLIITSTDVSVRSQISGTGTYLPLTMYTGGSERLRIDTSGNVGIGTSSPIAKLEVGGALTDTVPATYGGTIRVNSATQTTVEAIGGIEFPVAGDGYGYKIQQISSGGANLVFANRTASATWTERMRIDFGGNVGIGTASANKTSSSKALTLNAPSAANYSAFELTSGDATNFYLQANNSVANIVSTGTIPMAFFTNSSERMRIDSSGNVGIGTSSINAQTKLAVASASTITDARGILSVNSTNAATADRGGSISFGGENGQATSPYVFGAVSGRYAGSGYSGYLQLSTTDSGGTVTERMRIDSSGNVGIGTTPSDKLDVNGTIRITSGNTVRWVDAGTVRVSIQGDTSSNAIFSTAGSERMRIDSSGNLLVGRTSAGTSNAGGFSVFSSGLVSSERNGTVITANRFGSDGTIVDFRRQDSTVGTIGVTTLVTTYNTTSDYRLKTVIGSVSDAGTRIDALKPIEYDWNAGGKTRGFLAHQFAEIYPNSVSGEKDAVDAEGKPVYQGMQASTPEVMADLIAEIQSLRKRIATLESK